MERYTTVFAKDGCSLIVEGLSENEDEAKLQIKSDWIEMMPAEHGIYIAERLAGHGFVDLGIRYPNFKDSRAVHALFIHFDSGFDIDTEEREAFDKAREDEFKACGDAWALLREWRKSGYIAVSVIKELEVIGA